MRSLVDRLRPPAPPPDILDEGYLARLERHLGTAPARELLADGMLELSDRLDRLSEATESRDIESIAALTHEIVGAAGHLGLSLMTHHAAAASRAARSDPEEAFARARDLLGVRGESLDALRRRVSPGAEGTATDGDRP